MSLLKRPRLVAVLAIAGITATGLLKLLYFYLDDLSRNHSETFVMRLVEEGSSTVGEILLFPLLLLLCLRYPLSRSAWLRRLPAYTVALVGLSLGHTSWRAVSRAWLAPLAGLGQYDYGEMQWRYLMELPNDLLGMAALVALIHGVQYWEASRRREVRTAQLESQLALAQIQSLRLQLQPHFLFNTINTVSALIYESPDQADRILGRLSNLLRAMLQGSPRQETPLADELELVQGYLEIMRGRFEQRLDASVRLAPGVERAMVPQFLLQPLVENALRHGLEPDGRATLRVDASRANGRLVIDVSDRGPGFRGPGSTGGTGIGLVNTARRLATLHGEGASLTWENPADGGARVRVTLPWRVAAP